MNTNELSQLITIRDFAVRNFDNIHFKMSREEIRAMQAKIAVMDKQITKAILELNLEPKPVQALPLAKAPMKKKPMPVKRSEETMDQ